MPDSNEDRRRRLAIVTGGTRGLGAVLAKAFLSAGYNVIATYYHRHEEAQRFAHTSGVQIRGFDVSSANDCSSAISDIKRQYGPCSVLVNNAGINLDAKLEQLSPQNWNRVLDVNLGGCFNMTRAVLPGMVEQRWGRLIHISSVVSAIGGVGIANYISSKAAIEGLSRAIAIESAVFNVTSNVIAPGFLETGMIRSVPDHQVERLRARIPVGRLGAAEEVAHAALFLADDRAGYITGGSIPVDGGLGVA